MIYKWRFEKELKHIGPDYQHAFVRHDCTADTRTGRDVIEHFGHCCPRLLLVKLQQIKDVIGDTPPRTFRMFTGEQGMTVAPPCSPTDSHLSGDGVCSELRTPPAPKFDHRPCTEASAPGMSMAGGTTLNRFIVTATMPLSVPWNGGTAPAIVQLTS